MRKKAGVIVLIFLLVLCSTTFVLADSSLNKTRINDAFECLEKKVDGKCSTLSVTEIVFTILASPDSDILKECKDALDSKKSSANCWPKNGCKIKDTALAVLALDHLGEKTEEAEEWLLKKNKTATDLIWYLEQDSNDATECAILYEGKEDKINVKEDKKLTMISSTGSCLDLIPPYFWLKIRPSCYETEFSITCDKEFISTLLYKQQNSETIFVLSGTQSAPALDTINLKIKAKCFGLSSGCNYEDSVWATLALLETGNDVDEFVPYLVAVADSNKQYLPNSFIYAITNYEDYGNKLIKEQRLGNYWQADSSAFGKFYDTALALNALRGSSSEQVENTKKWLLSPFSQSLEGCWQSSNTIRDTAMVLWALEGRAPSLNGGGGTTYCSEANFFCVPSSECPSNLQLDNYFCSGLSKVCCKESNLKTCSELNGEICDSDEECDGNEERTIDGKECCLEKCKIKKDEPQTAGCGDMNYECKDECSDKEEEINYECDFGDVCCRTKPKESSSWWIWLLIIGIIGILGALLYLKRDKLRLMIFKSRSRFKKESGGPKSGFPPSKPGFPPIRRMIPRRPMPSGRAPQRRDKAMDDTFKKLKEMVGG